MPILCTLIRFHESYSFYNTPTCFTVLNLLMCQTFRLQKNSVSAHRVAGYMGLLWLSQVKDSAG